MTGPGHPDAAHPGFDHVTPYDRLAWTDVEVEALLARGEHRAELQDFFGPDEYRTLVALARAAARAEARRSRPHGRVIIVPGTMGSQLGLDRPPPLPNDLLWLDPADIAAGRLLLLKVATTGRIRPQGVVLYSYLRLKLQLRARGFDAVFHDYDWRLGIDELGHQLAQRLAAEPRADISLVGHSMGGLVSRAALALPGAARVRRVVLLGTPNAGSFACVQALRGTYAVVRKLARLDAHNSAEYLAEEVFSTFPALYHMLPAASGRLDFMDPRAWPASGPAPKPELLRSARVIRQALAPADGRFAVIVGVDRDTVTRAALRRGDFLYTLTRHGDGTVPADSARLAGARTWYARVSHSDLTRDPTVAVAVADLLRSGTTSRLRTRWSPRSRATARVTDHALRATQLPKVDLAALTPDARREFLQNLNEPPQLTLKAPARKSPGRPLRPRRRGLPEHHGSPGRRAGPKRPGRGRRTLRSGPGRER